MKHRKRKPVSQMGNAELSNLHKTRSPTFSWVAFLDGESDRTVEEYLRNAMRGISEIDKEMDRREMKIRCH